MEAGAKRERGRKQSASKLAAFEKLKRAKTEGKKNKYEVTAIENVYEEVTEREYTESVLKRQEDDWIIGDYGAEGYVEDGREIFDDDLDEESIKKNRNSKKHDRSVVSKNTEATKGSIEKMLANMPAKRKREVKLDEDDILGDLMQEIDTPTSKMPRRESKTNCRIMEEKRKAEEYLKSFNSFQNRSSCKPSLNIEITKSASSRITSTELSTVAKRITSAELSTVAKIATVSNIDENSMSEAFGQIDESELVGMGEVAIEKKTKSNDCEFIDDWTPPAFDETMLNNSIIVDASQEDELQFEKVKSNEQLCDNWETISKETASVRDEPSVANMNVDVSQLPIIEKDGKKALKFFYWDAYEDIVNQPGTVFLFGKVWLDSVNVYASCCITVKNIQRRIFFLPREKKFDLAKKKSLDEDVKIIDVYQEFNTKISEKYKIMKFRSKKSTKDYAFDIADVPDKSEYLEVQYPATDRALPANLDGETFSHVFGTNTGPLESLLLERKIKGPSWLAIADVFPVSCNVSWCKFELQCDDMANISVLKEGGSPPPLVVMSLSLRISPIPKTHDNQITMIGWLVHNDYCTDKAAPSPPFKDHCCALTKPVNAMWPFNAKSTKEDLSKQAQTNVEKATSERELLSYFLAKYHKIDPDLIVGHDIYGFDIGTLIHRLIVNKVQNWSRLGRLRRSQVPAFTKGKNVIERIVMCGRLVCDVKITAKELIRARSYDLSSLCEQVLHMREDERKQVKAEEIVDMYSSVETLLTLIKLTMSDALYILRIMYNFNAIPLALQITNIAGNVMSRTLMGGRSERNEFLLLHAFNEKNYIVPDKQYLKKPVKEVDSEIAKGAKGKRKPQYEGGLVLEPKRGFYDKLILLMDFNSLYPSIIQEYNICFTTISIRGMNTENEENFTFMMEQLPSNSEPGILPTEIKKLVESRRQVKLLMKKSDISSDLRHQYDIRQLALKLTANSMYGCLGFPNSRFYAKPLAAMVTAKGREILMNTRDLVQRLNYDVIYGDTDSLMINTNCINYDEVFGVGNKIKVEVNKLYKQIELDVDGVFQFMLLLKKKKYAAVSLSKVNGKLIAKQEIKGLDVVRRDWSQLSAGAGKFVLNEILSDQNLDDKLANIRAHLQKLKTDLEENRVPVSLLAISKQLTKNPEDYPDKKALPHVQVAIRMNSTMTKKFKQGDTIAYVVCEDGTINSATQRGYHVDELKTNDKLKIDIKYYLSQQIHPVVTRLCEPFDGIDAVHIAEDLGLDPNVYHNIRRMDTIMAEDDEITIEKTDMFINCDKFEFQCMNESCKIINSIDAPLVKNDKGEFEFVLGRCCGISCNVPPYTYVNRIQNELWTKMNGYVHTYYQNWLICEDPICAYRTRNVICINKSFELECPQCKRSNLVREYTESQLYHQLSFFQYMFDHTSFVSQHKELKLDAESSLAMAYSKLKDAADVVLSWNAYNIIDLSKICKLMLMK